MNCRRRHQHLVVGAELGEVASVGAHRRPVQPVLAHPSFQACPARPSLPDRPSVLASPGAPRMPCGPVVLPGLRLPAGPRGRSCLWGPDHRTSPVDTRGRPGNPRQTLCTPGRSRVPCGPAGPTAPCGPGGPCGPGMASPPTIPGCSCVSEALNDVSTDGVGSKIGFRVDEPLDVVRRAVEQRPAWTAARSSYRQVVLRRYSMPLR